MTFPAAGSLELGKKFTVQNGTPRRSHGNRTAAPRRSPSPDDLEQMGEAAWWAGKPDEASETLERAFTASCGGVNNETAAGAPSSRLHVLPSPGTIDTAQVHHKSPRGHARNQKMAQPLHLSASRERLTIRYRGTASPTRDRHHRRQGGNTATPTSSSWRRASRAMARLDEGNLQEGSAVLDKAAAAANPTSSASGSPSDILCNTMGRRRINRRYKARGPVGRAGQGWIATSAVGWAM